MKSENRVSGLIPKEAKHAWAGAPVKKTNGMAQNENKIEQKFTTPWHGIPTAHNQCNWSRNHWSSTDPSPFVDGH